MYSSETWDVVFTLTDSKIKEVRAICVTGFPLNQENLEKSWNNGIKPRKKRASLIFSASYLGLEQCSTL